MVAALVLVAAAALVHVWIFVLESLAWTSPRARATFGQTREQADATAALAFNQGFYNLFLAVAAGAGVVVLTLASTDVTTAVGAALVFTGAGSMVAAGSVLAASDRSMLRPALVQAGPPLIGVVLLALALSR